MRLLAALRRAAGSIDVEVYYRDGQIRIVDVNLGGGRGYERGQADPPPADIVVSSHFGLIAAIIARARWDGRTVSGSADPDGMIGFTPDTIGGAKALEWDEWAEYRHSDGSHPSRPRPADPGHRQLTLWKGDALPGPGAHAKMLAVRDASGATFADALEAWVWNLRENIAAFEAIDLSGFVRCESCEALLHKDDSTKAWGDFYCEEHAPAFCDKCAEPVPESEECSDESGNTYCSGCYEEEFAADFEEISREFYAEHPELEDIAALQNAGDEVEMEPEAYVAIFGDLPWRSSYGGEAWAHIAETWRDLREAVDREDWTRMHLLSDHAFDLVHNTGSLFTKAQEGVKSWLFKALEDKYFLDPLQYRDKLSPDARKLLDMHIRYSGGVAAWRENMTRTGDAMSKFEKALMRDQDERMAERLWKVHRLSPQMFHGRDSFLDVAFWSESKTRAGALDAASAVRAFIRAPDRRTAVAALAAVGPYECQAGTGHPAGSVLRKDFLPKLMDVVGGDPVLRRLVKPAAKVSKKEMREFAKAFSLHDWLPTAPDDIRHELWWWSDWAEFLAGTARRREEETAIASALAAGFLRLAMSSVDFYDFYALSVVDCRRLPDDLARMCEGLKKVTALDVAKALLKILARAVVREARHVQDALGKGD